MKTNDIMKAFCLTALAIGVASCQNDEIESNSTTVATQDSQIRVSCTVAGGVESRAMVELNNEDTTAEYFQWNEGDSFTLYDIGSDGVTIPTDYTTFTISDYSDDDPSAYADFIGTGTLTEGNQVLAIYPAQGEISSNKLTWIIDYEAQMGKVYADYQEYMSSQMYMYATAQVDDADSGLELEFNHLTCMARITYTNYTDEEQSIEYVDFRGDGTYIGQGMVYDFEEGAFSCDYASRFTQQYYRDDFLTVAPNDSVDLYLIFFPGNEFADDGTLTITIDHESVEMSTSDFPHTSFQAGYRYWFNVAKTDDGLIWTKDYVDEESDSNNSTDVSELLIGTWITTYEHVIEYDEDGEIDDDDVDENGGSKKFIFYSDGTCESYEYTGKAWEEQIVDTWTYSDGKVEFGTGDEYMLIISLTSTELICEAFGTYDDGWTLWAYYIFEKQ